MRRIAAVLTLALPAFVALVGVGPAALGPFPAPVAAQAIGAEPSRWWSDLDRVDGLLESGKWAKAGKIAEELRHEVTTSSWREPDLRQVYVEIALRLAVASAERGDRKRALWEWDSALAHEGVAGPARGSVALVERDLSAYPKAAELFAGRSLRALGEYPPGEPPVEVRPDRDFQPATAPAFEPAPLANGSATREAVAPVHFEVFIDREGHVRQPVVTTDWSNPVVVQWGLDTLRASPTFRPATLDGEPIGWLGPIELTLANRPAKRW
jgi:hypothetical protein